MSLVVIESPFAGRTDQEAEEHLAYARRCMADSLARGEYPLASHLLYTQPGILRDGIPEERRLGIEAGLAWAERADSTVLYLDRGCSPGMAVARERAIRAGRPVVERCILSPAGPPNEQVSKGGTVRDKSTEEER